MILLGVVSQYHCERKNSLRINTHSLVFLSVTQDCWHHGLLWGLMTAGSWVPPRPTEREHPEVEARNQRLEEAPSVTRNCWPLLRSGSYCSLSTLGLHWHPQDSYILSPQISKTQTVLPNCVFAIPNTC